MEIELNSADGSSEDKIMIESRWERIKNENKSLKRAIEVGILGALIIFCAIFWGVVSGHRAVRYCPDTIGITVMLGLILFFLVAFYLLWLVVIRHIVRLPGSRVLCLPRQLEITAIDIAMISVITFMTIICVVIFGIQAFMMSNTLPNLDATLNFPGKLQDTVKIHREENGMIHIIASNEHDLYFAQGVASAQDRLFQMEFQRRAASGTLSAVVGSGGTSIDRYFRTLNFYSYVTGAIDSYSPECRAAILAYVDGVNAYLETKPNLPMEFHLLGFEPAPWTVEDVMVWGKMLSQDLSLNSEDEIVRLQLLVDLGISPERILEIYPPYRSGEPSILNIQELQQSGIYSNSTFQLETDVELERVRQDQQMYSGKTKREEKKEKRDSHADRIFQEFQQNMKGIFSPTAEASNNWVIHGNLTASGKPLLANDPHLSLRLPMIWMMMHLQTPDNDFIGACFAGVPFIIIGRNNHISWGVTNSGADVQDLYIVDEDPSDPTKYWADGQLLSYVVRNEIIHISGADDMIFPCLDTIFGPVANEYVGNAGNLKLALRWNSLTFNDTSIESLYRYNSAPLSF
eukprot:TRINITY_DN9005_c0_g1_i4.p1 TRINITY_DN9005_c0_g1~~TRINITY_DN9005_c0_g1_i4.p1  ORF type:complete len:581 (+),score=160.04 TRINITY_DN9005_c0_g1_i4:26-1744(+)